MVSVPEKNIGKINKGETSFIRTKYDKETLQNLKTELNNLGIHNVCISEKNKIYEL
jgi:hypothetical protein